MNTGRRPSLTSECCGESPRGENRLTADDVREPPRLPPGAGAARAGGRARWRRTSPWGASRARSRSSTRCARGACACCCRSCCPTTTWTGARTRARAPWRACSTAADGAVEPAGERLGRTTGADAVLLPGLAVDARGMRLARRRLVRPCAGPPGARGRRPALVVLLYDSRSSSASPRSRTTARCTRWAPSVRRFGGDRMRTALHARVAVPSPLVRLTA